MKKIVIVIPSRKSGGVETYSKYITENNIELIDEIYLSDHGVKNSILFCILKIVSIRRMLWQYETIITSGQYGIVASSKQNLKLVIHGNPLSYFLHANHIFRFLNFKAWILLLLDLACLYISILKSKNVYFVADHVMSSFLFKKFFILNKKQKFKSNYTIIFNSKKNILVDKLKNENLISISSNAHYAKGLDRVDRFCNLYSLQCNVWGVSKKINSNKFINYKGIIDNSYLLDEISNSNALILLSRYEGLPLVILESLHQGIPCIISNEKWSVTFKDLKSILIIDPNLKLFDKNIYSKIQSLIKLNKSEVIEDYRILTEKLNNAKEIVK